MLGLDKVIETIGKGEPLPEPTEKAFFSRLILPGRISKATYSHRLDDLNALVEPVLPSTRPLRILDLGISSGISTLEWIDLMEAKNIEFEIDAVDLVLRAVLISFRIGIDVLADKSGRPFVIQKSGNWIAYPPGKRDLLKHFLLIFACRTILFLFWGKFRIALSERHAEKTDRWFKVREVPLVYSRLRNHPKVSLFEADIRGPLDFGSQAFHVIRAANILNRSFFDDAELMRIIAKLRDRLCMGGVLIVCRTDDTQGNTATVFSKGRGDRLEPIVRLNGGSEVERLVQNL
jgi:hypothetical protein